MTDRLRINQYLLGKMKPEDASAFQKKIEADPALRSQVQAIEATLEATRLLQIEQTKKNLLAHKAKKKRQNTFRKGGTLLAILLLLGFLYWTSQSSTQTQIDEAQANACAQAIKNIESLTKSQRQTSPANLSIAHQHIKDICADLNSPTPDLPALRETIKALEARFTTDPELEKALAFYVAMAHFKLDDKDKGFAALQRVVDIGGNSQQQARDLLKLQ